MTRGGAPEPAAAGDRAMRPMRPMRPMRAVTRRGSARLVAVASAAAAPVAFTGCDVPLHPFLMQSRMRQVEDTPDADEAWYATVCRRCDAGCGTIVRVIEGRARKVEGNPGHPVNLGRLCARGQAAVQEEYHPDRVRSPLRREGEQGQGTFAAVSWKTQLTQLAARLRRLRDSGRAGQVVLITPPMTGTRGRIVERFAAAYGAQWLAFDPLPEAPLREASRRLFGQAAGAGLPHFDLQNARYAMSFGADFLGAWVAPVRYGVEYGVFRQGVYRAGAAGSITRGPTPPATATAGGDRPRGYLVYVGPHMSVTAASADEWVYVPPGREPLVALAMAQVIVSEGLAAPAAAGIFDTSLLEQFRPERVTAATTVPVARLRQLARDFASRTPSVALAGGEAGAQTNGTDGLTAILALNALVGGVEAPGGIRFPAPVPVADVPNDVAASPLAAWEALAARLRAGQVDTVLVYDANPVYGLPAGLRFGEALRAAPFIASFSSFVDDTTALADVVLPSHLMLEDWGDSMLSPGTRFPTYTVQQPVVQPFFDTRSFWDVLLALAAELGEDIAAALPWTTLKDALQDTARALQQLDRGSVRDPSFPRFWTRLLQRGGWWDVDAPTVTGGAAGETAGTATLMVETNAAAVRAAITRLGEPRFAGSAAEYPLALVPFPHNTLRAGDGAHLPWLQAAPDPVTSVVWRTWVEVNPGLARTLALREGDVVRLESSVGRIEVPAYINPAAPPDVLAVPLGQGHAAYGRWASARDANPFALLAPLTDEATGALAYAATRVRLTKTGRRVPLPKLEGSVPAYQLPGARVLKVTRTLGDQ